MAQVHLGRLVGPEGYSRTVAIKRLHRELARAGTFRSAILEEGRLASRIRHPNVVAPIDVVADGNELLLVMEYVHGESLARLLRVAALAKEAVPLGVAAAIVTNLLYGLDAAHEARDEAGTALDIVHRDISPQNVIVGADGVARVIDFGIAKAVTTARSTTTGIVKGKLPYLAPEQLEGEQATRRTDIYAAGVVLWEVLVGKRLFHGNDDAEILQKILSANVPPPSTRGSHVPSAVDDVVARMVARNPRDRYATAREAVNAIESVAELATPSKISAWVLHLANDSLVQRARLLAQVEARGMNVEVELETALYRRDAAPPSQQVTGRTAELATSVAVPSSRTVELPPAAPPSSRTAELPNRPTPPTPSPADEPTGRSKRKGLSFLTRTQAPQRAEGIVSVQPARRSTRVTYAIVGILFVAFMISVGVPWIIRKLIVRAAHQHGIAIRVERLETSWKSIRLIEVTGGSTELPGVTLRARGARIGLSGLSANDLTIDDLEVETEGSYEELSKRFEQFRAAHKTDHRRLLRDLKRVMVSSAHIEAREVLGPDSSIVFENASLDTHPSNLGSIGADVRFSSPLVTVHVGSTRAGPWSVNREWRGPISTTKLRFDASASPTAGVTLTQSEDGSEALLIVIPSMRLAEMRITRALTPDGLFTPETRIDARINLTTAAVPDKRVASGRATMGVGSVRVLPRGQAMDVVMDVALNGEPPKPLQAKGTIALGNSQTFAAVGGQPLVNGALSGTVETSGLAFRADLTGETAGSACGRSGAAAPSGVRAKISGRLDRLDTMTLNFEPTGACAPRPK